MNCRGSGSAHHCANNTLGWGASLHYSVFNCSTSVTNCGGYRKPMGRGVLPYLPCRVTYALPTSKALTSVKDYSSSSPSFFGRHDQCRQTSDAHDRLVQKIAPDCHPRSGAQFKLEATPARTRAAKPPFGLGLTLCRTAFTRRRSSARITTG